MDIPKQRPVGPAWASAIGEELEEASRARELLRKSQAVHQIVLDFYAGGGLVSEVRERWLRVTGTSEMTTRTMCDAIRAVRREIDELLGA